MLHPLVYPFFAMVLLTFLFALFMFYVRVTAIKKGQVKFSYFKVFHGEATEMVLKTSRHFINLFEVPVIYYATLLLAIFMNLSSDGLYFFAWLFVAARVAHAYAHVCLSNIYPRMLSYFCGWLAVLGLWGVILCS